jgi:hypothetical protein
MMQGSAIFLGPSRRLLSWSSRRLWLLGWLRGRWLRCHLSACQEDLELSLDLCELCTKVTHLLEEILLCLHSRLELNFKSGNSLLQVILELVPFLAIKELLFLDVLADIVVGLEVEVRLLLIEIPGILARRRR